MVRDANSNTGVYDCPSRYRKAGTGILVFNSIFLRTPAPIYLWLSGRDTSLSIKVPGNRDTSPKNCGGRDASPNHSSCWDTVPIATAVGILAPVIMMLGAPVPKTVVVGLPGPVTLLVRIPLPISALVGITVLITVVAGTPIIMMVLMFSRSQQKTNVLVRMAFRCQCIGQYFGYDFNVLGTTYSKKMCRN